MAKKETVERLLKDGHINFDEALELMDREIVREFISYPQVIQYPQLPPYTQPIYPNHNEPWYIKPQITC